MRSDRYDIDAKPPDFAKSKESMPAYSKVPLSQEQRQMLQALLAERFGLRFHRETREGAVFLLEKGSRPLKWSESKDRDKFPWANIVADGLRGENENMPDLASRLSEMLARPVIDRTGITGSYDFRISYVQPDDRQDTIAAIHTTLRDLGLKPHRHDRDRKRRQTV